MKKNKPLAGLTLALAFAILFAASCKKSNDSNNNNYTGISATLGTQAFQSTYLLGQFNQNTLQLNGFQVKSGGDTSVIYVGILSSIKINQPDPLSNSEVWYGKHDGTIYTSGSLFGGHGTLTVTSWDTAGKKITGTFNGIFYNTHNSMDSMTVTNGHFNTSYTVY
ncbi:MAG: hypothetical protein BGO55_16760 [Sphingobacteriales bacterium 50-39]|nr:DUF5025 domain-containing protein [Sphingobacteriales bacterium]OJW60130.1 MAG: hypothetical protein BGO55_16760 [Sphingobacteriales bacterium 50-39]